MMHKCKRCGEVFKSNRSKRSFCSPECYRESLIGSVLSVETRRKMSESKQGYTPVKLFKSGSDHPAWIEDRYSGNPRWKKEYEEWRLSVFARDNVCVNCGSSRKLHAHHKIPLKVDKSLVFDLANGVLLCNSCHAKEHKPWNTIKRWQDLTGKEAVKIG